MPQRFRATIILSAIFLGLLTGLFWYFHGKQTTEEEVHYHATFHVYRNNTLIDFSGAQYMHIEPCSDHPTAALTKEETQQEKAHLHDNVGDVVHVHRNGVRWKELFKNLNYDMSGTVVGYVNGERVFGILNKVIKPYDRALFLLGDNTGIDAKISAVPSVEYIKSVEKKSETCGS